MNHLFPLLMLLHFQGLGRASIKKLIENFGGPAQVLSEGFDPTKRILFGKYPLLNWERDYEMACKNGVSLIAYTDPLYPKEFFALPDFPLLLYVKGNFIREGKRRIAIVGTRSASLYGRESAHKIAHELASAGVSIISGLARGIDTAAHEGALMAKGETIALLGSGICNLYPKENRNLAEQISDSGALISEYPMEREASKGSFPQRNRLVAELSEGVCLIESPLRGGGMLTMNLAQQQGKLLFALPGRVDFPSFEGNHDWIKKKSAHLIEKGSDMLKYLNINVNQSFSSLQLPLLTEEENLFLAKMPVEEKSIEELVLLTQLPIMQLNVYLTRLVLKKVIKEFPGKIFKKMTGHGKSTDHC